MWQYIVGAFTLLFGVLIGAGLKSHGEDGFTMLIKSMEKINQTKNKIEGQNKYYTSCKECPYTATHDTAIGAEKDLEHHVLTKHPTATHQCPFCPIVVESDLSNFITQDRMRNHILSHHPERQEEAAVWRPVSSSVAPSQSTPSA